MRFNSRMCKIRHIVSTLVLLVATLSVSAQLYSVGERLEYRVGYIAKMFPNTEVGSVVISTSLDTLASKGVYRVTGHAKTLPAYRWFFNLDDRYDILVDTATLRTQRFESNLHEGDYTFRSHYRYDWSAMSIDTWAQSRGRTPRTRTMSLTPRSMDPVSLYFNMRAVDTDTLHVGKRYDLEMVLEDTIRVLKIRMVGREICKVPQMGRFRTIKLACTIGTSESFSLVDGVEFFMWISDDRNRVPLMLSSPIKVGSVRAYITSLRGLKYPLDCRVK